MDDQPDAPGRRPPELWAGVECSVVRVGDGYFDQLEANGHARRLDDLDRLASLGVAAVRQPALWERVAPDGPGRADWAWLDARLGRLRALGVRPILGLVHHGSGPPSTSLVAPDFPARLAEYARAVAGRYPWVEDYTPVNEPLTTARFCGLYGHWHPHGRDDRTFARALANQCRAVALAMQAIRAANPAARLIQTDDLGKTHAAPALAYQADFENERRWLAFDLLCGRVDRGHPLRGYLLGAGIDDRELDWFVEHPCPPDVLGLNHYLTSERYLDDRVEHYPRDLVGGNGRQAYADVEAVRVQAAGSDGPAALLREAWDRYRRPMAVTELHLGCTREEQLRWAAEVWRAAIGLRAEGVGLRAVTAWAAFGSHDWDTLMVRPSGRYEPGLFDVRAPQPRPTALAGLFRDLADGREPDHPALDGPGWWGRPDRLHYPPAGGPAAPGPGGLAARPIAILGAGGRLGRAFALACARRGLATLSLPEAESGPDGFAAMLDAAGAWAVIDAAFDPSDPRRVRVEGAAGLAGVCARRGLALLAFSSDRVFGGPGQAPRVETDRVEPGDDIGRTLAEAERRILEAHPAAMVVRTSTPFGDGDAGCPVRRALDALAAGRRFEACDAAVVAPTFLPDLAHAALDLLVDGERGVWHLANPGALTEAGLARLAAEMAGLDPARVVALPSPMDPPAWRVLGSARGWLLPPVEAALRRCLREHGPSGVAPAGSPPPVDPCPPPDFGAPLDALPMPV